MTEAQWRCLEPHLPPEKPRTGRPNEDHRRILNGILWVLRTGAPWRDLPRRYGRVGTVSSRFYRWRASGVWERILSALQAAADARGEVDRDLHFVDASVIRAHQHPEHPGWGAAKRPTADSLTGGRDSRQCRSGDSLSVRAAAARGTRRRTVTPRREEAAGRRRSPLRWPPGVLLLSAAMDRSYVYTAAGLAR